MVGVELVCSDLAEHRRRVESRTADVPGLVLPNWEKVVARDYSPWLDADLRMDTARTPPDVSAGRIRDLLQSGDAGASFDQVGTPDR